MVRWSRRRGKLLESELSYFNRRSEAPQQERASISRWLSERQGSLRQVRGFSRQGSTVHADQQPEWKIPRLLIAHRLMISSSAGFVVAQQCVRICSGANTSDTPQGSRPMRRTPKAALSLTSWRAGVLVSGAESCPCVSPKYPLAAILSNSG